MIVQQTHKCERANCINITSNKKYCSRSCLGKDFSMRYAQSAKRKQGISLSKKGISLSSKAKLAISIGKTGKIQPNISKAKLGKNILSLRGQKRSDETKKKMRISHLQNIDDKLICRRGKNEKDLLDLQEMLFGVKIARQFQIKDLGYIVDGFCPQTNTVYEVYEEKRHLKNFEKDQIRQKEIQNSLNCDFKIIWDDHLNSKTIDIKQLLYL